MHWSLMRNNVISDNIFVGKKPTLVVRKRYLDTLVGKKKKMCEE